MVSQGDEYEGIQKPPSVPKQKCQQARDDVVKCASETERFEQGPYKALV